MLAYFVVEIKNIILLYQPIIIIITFALVKRKKKR